MNQDLENNLPLSVHVAPNQGALSPMVKRSCLKLFLCPLCECPHALARMQAGAHRRQGVGPTYSFTGVQVLLLEFQPVKKETAAVTQTCCSMQRTRAPCPLSQLKHDQL